MQNKYYFELITTHDNLANLESNWLKSLTSPQDGMWESIRNQSDSWAIKQNEEIIGFFNLKQDNELIQFYILPKYLFNGPEIFKKILDLKSVKKAIIGTNNPIFHTIANHFVKQIEVHTYLFHLQFEVFVKDKKGDFRICNVEDTKRIVNFTNYSTGDSIEWLNGYILNLIKKRELFVFENNTDIIGICEVQKSISQSGIADIGMIVSPDYRRNGYGTFLLNKAKEIAIERGMTPICSCEKDNIGSFKSIHNCGFVSMAQLLLMKF